MLESLSLQWSPLRDVVSKWGYNKESLSTCQEPFLTLIFMQNIVIRAIGKLNEDWHQQAIHRYSKLISQFAKLDIVELQEGQKGAKKPDIQLTRTHEALELDKGIPKNSYLIALDETGRELTSSDFSKKLGQLADSGKNVVFLLGGSWGLDESVRQKADLTLSLGHMTYPHALARIVLLEQIYRAFMILGGRTYHK